MRIKIALPQALLDQLINEVVQHLPEEACGFLTGTSEGIVENILPVENIQHQTKSFKMDGLEQLNKMQEMEEKRQTWLGIYHSHPEGEAYPSNTDIISQVYPEIAMFICAPNESGWQVKAFWVNEGLVEEEALEVLK
ncbi:MAG: M67 family metallopeptidase [Anaerolineae bacterium]|nr:M67 family metallopeptidase [Anaerolineae bacterium]